MQGASFTALLVQWRVLVSRRCVGAPRPICEDYLHLVPPDRVEEALLDLTRVVIAAGRAQRRIPPWPMMLRNRMADMASFQPPYHRRGPLPDKGLPLNRKKGAIG